MRRLGSFWVVTSMLLASVSVLGVAQDMKVYPGGQT